MRKKKLILTNHIQPFLLSQDITAHSRITYRHAIQQFISWCVQQKIKKYDRTVILRYKAWIDSLPLSAFTKSLYLVVVRRFFSWTEEHNIYDNVAHGIKGAKLRSKSHFKDSLTIQNIKKLLDAIEQTTLKGKRDFALINTLIRTGIRLKEIAAADINDIEKFQHQTRLWVHGKGRHGKDEFVMLTDDVLKPITRYLAARETSLQRGTPLFISVSDRNFGQRLTTFSLSRIVRHYLTKAGIKTKRITAHSLRHTFGVLSMQAGASLYEIQLAMRHAAPSTTEMYLGDMERIKRLEASPEHKMNDLLQSQGI